MREIKYFHELTEEEFNKLPNMTWGECAEQYAQPQWCSYPNAVCGLMGCWSLMGFDITGRKNCIGCDYYIPQKRKVRGTK